VVVTPKIAASPIRLRPLGSPLYGRVLHGYNKDA
jgi:hypothetical protein